MKILYKGNYTKLTPELHQAIAKLYSSGLYTTEYLAKTYNVTTRTIQRIARKHGVIRTLAHSNKLIAPLKNYHTIPLDMRVKRKQLSNKTRVSIILNHPYCAICGMRVSDGVRLEVDHIDNNPMNNEPSNLQVLCALCNRGKADMHRFPVTR